MSYPMGLDEMTAPVVHPAPYSAPILELLAELIPDGSMVLDPFAGTGRIHQLADPVRGIDTTGIEIEPEWAALHPDTICGDATKITETCWRWVRLFDVVATSPCSTRRSYTHDLRAFTGDPERQLAENNGGRMHWGAEYRALHEKAWGEVWKLLRPGGLFLLNVSDHIRAKQVVPVTEWHRQTVLALGFVHRETHQVTTRRQKHGENRERVECEEVQVYIRP